MESIETRVKELETAVGSINKLLEDNGQPGLRSQVNTLCSDLRSLRTEWNTQATERDRYERKHGLKLNVLIGVCGLVGTLMLILEGLRMAH